MSHDGEPRELGTAASAHGAGGGALGPQGCRVRVGARRASTTRVAATARTAAGPATACSTASAATSTARSTARTSTSTPTGRSRPRPTWVAGVIMDSAFFRSDAPTPEPFAQAAPERVVGPLLHARRQDELHDPLLPARRHRVRPRRQAAAAAAGERQRRCALVPRHGPLGRRRDRARHATCRSGTGGGGRRTACSATRSGATRSGEPTLDRAAPRRRHAAEEDHAQRGRRGARLLLRRRHAVDALPHRRRRARDLQGQLAARRHARRGDRARVPRRRAGLRAREGARRRARVRGAPRGPGDRVHAVRRRRQDPRGDRPDRGRQADRHVADLRRPRHAAPRARHDTVRAGASG